MMRGTRFEVWSVAVLTIGCWFVAAPRSASADCVTFYVSGSSDGVFVEGSATIWLDIEGCWAEEYSGIVDTDVVVDGPGGWSFDTQSGYAFATASTFVAVNGGYGTYGVFGDGYAHFIWWYFEHYEDSTSVFVPPPPLPVSLRLTLNAFIPYEWIIDPFYILTGSRIFEGDDRSWAENGSSRVSQIMDLWNQYWSPGGIFLAGPHEYAALSIQYETSTSLDAGQHLTQAARDDWTPGPPMKTAWAIGQNTGDGCSGSYINAMTVSIRCFMDSPNPVYGWLAPDIEWRWYMTFGFTPTALVNYSIYGCRKYFPAYEIWAAGHQIYAGPDSGSVFDLLIPCDSAVWVEKTGEVIMP
jgi:hypothetical protein